MDLAYMSDRRHQTHVAGGYSRGRERDRLAVRQVTLASGGLREKLWTSEDTRQVLVSARLECLAPYNPAEKLRRIHRGQP